MLSISRCNTIGFRLILALSVIVITLMAISPQPDFLQASINDKVGHALTFLYLSFMLHSSFPRNSFNFRFFIVLLAYGIFIEIAQHFVPSREFSIADMVADAAGIILYILLLPLVIKVTDKLFSLPDNEM